MTRLSTLEGLYPLGVTFSGFAPASAARWVSSDLQARLSLTGAPLPVRGSMPMLCSAGSIAGAAVVEDLTPDGIVSPTDGVVSFTSEDDYRGELRRLAGMGARMVTQHRHPDDLLAPRSSWIPPTVQGTLNDKGCLADLVPAHAVPQRQVGDPRDPEWIAALHRGPFPLMLKAATRFSTGGGALDLAPSATASDLGRALSALAGSERLVAEQWIDDRARHLCVNAAILPDGEVHLVGSAEIISSRDGTYLGNWLGDAEAWPTTMDLVLEIARAGASRGYLGLLGVDVAEFPDGTTLAYDLNFRLCGSTAPLMVAPAVLGPSGATVARFRPWLLDVSLAEAAQRLERVRAIGLVPISLFDPAAHALNGPIRVASLVVGTSRPEIEERITEIEAILH